jgi:hypothetical protein
MTVCAWEGLLQKSGASISFSNPESLISFEGKSKTLQQLLGQILGCL